MSVLFPASGTEEEIFVNTTKFPIFLLFSSDSSGCISWNHIARRERVCVHLSTHSPRSEFLWSELIKTPNFVEIAISYTRFSSYSTPRTRCCLLADVTIGIFRIMNEHRVVFSKLRSNDTFLAIGIFVRISAPASVTTEGNFSAILFSLTISRLESHPAFGGEEDASRCSNPSAHGCNRSSNVSSNSCPRSKCPVAVENSKGWLCFCLVTATTETKFSMLRSITLFSFGNLEGSPDAHE